MVLPALELQPFLAEGEKMVVGEERFPFLTSAGQGSQFGVKAQPLLLLACPAWPPLAGGTRLPVRRIVAATGGVGLDALPGSCQS